MKFYQLLFLLLYTFSLSVFSQSKHADSLSLREQPVFEVNLDSVVISGDRFINRKADSYIQIEVIDKTKISSSNGERLSDVLRISNSLNIKSYGSPVSLQTVSMNGLSSTHTLVLIDGVKLNSFQNSGFDLSAVPKDNIRKIEVINNGSSSIYGSEAVGGVINIITDNALNNIEKSFSGKITSSLNTFSSKSFSLSLSGSYEKLKAGFYASSISSDGRYNYYFTTKNGSELKERENSGYNGTDFSINLFYPFSNEQTLSFYTHYMRQYKEVPGIETGGSAPRTNQNDKNINSILTYKRNFNSNISSQTTLNFQNNFSVYNNPPLIRSNYKNLVYSLSNRFDFRLGRVDITANYEFVYASLESNEVKGLPIRRKHSASIVAEYRMFDNLVLFPSLRYETFTDIDEEIFTEGIGLNYRPLSDIPINLKLNFGKNFRAPSFNDLYWKQGGNPNLMSENSENSEIGAIWSFNNYFSGNIEISYRYISFINKIIWMPNRQNIWSPKNIGASDSKVISLSLSVGRDFGNSLEIKTDLGLNYTDARKKNEDFKGDPSLNRYVYYVPLSSINANLFLIYENYGIGIFYSRMGVRYSDFENKKELKPYSLISGNVFYKLNFKGIESEIRLEADNLFDEDYQIIEGYPMPLRSIKIQIMLKI